MDRKAEADSCGNERKEIALQLHSTLFEGNYRQRRGALPEGSLSLRSRSAYGALLLGLANLLQLPQIGIVRENETLIVGR